MAVPPRKALALSAAPKSSASAGHRGNPQPARFVADARARHPKGMAGVLCLPPSSPHRRGRHGLAPPRVGGRMSALGLCQEVAFSARLGVKPYRPSSFRGLLSKSVAVSSPGQSGATRHPPGQVRGEKVLRLMGVGVQKEPGPTLQAHKRHAPVGEGVALRADISRNTPLSAASAASSSVISPGWARMSTSRDSSAARLLPGSTGSTIVSPWTRTIWAPRSLARCAASPMSPLGTWVISTPARATIPQASDALRHSSRRVLITRSWSPRPRVGNCDDPVVATCALLMSSMGDSTPSLR